MSFFRKLFGKHQDEAQQQTKQAEVKQTNTKQPETPEAKNDQPDSHMVIVTMLATANTALTKGEYSRAADTYKQILNLESQNTTAQYNLGQLYLRGNGVEQNFVEAAKLFRSAAEFGNDGYAQNFLAVLYNTGSGVKRNDLAALYWFDRATDNGVEVAKKSRDGIFNLYRSDRSPEEFNSLMQTLSDYCKTGTADIPQDIKKAAYWLEKKRPLETQQQVPGEPETSSNDADNPNACIMELLIEHLLMRFHIRIPETGTFEPNWVVFGTTITGDFSNLYVDRLGIIIEPDTKDSNYRWLKAGAFFLNSDYGRYAYLIKGTNQELEEYLNTPEARKKITEVLLSLDRNARKDEVLGED